MNEIVKSFSLSFLLRSVFSGTFFVLAYYEATRGSCVAINMDSKDIFSTELVFALVAGVTVYGIHRSIIFPWIEWTLNADWARARRQGSFTLISENVIVGLAGRWDRRAAKGSRHQNRAEQISIWGDYVHLQYASAWCILFGYVTGRSVGGNPHSLWWSVIALTAFFFGSASISAWRLHGMEERWPLVDEN